MNNRQKVVVMPQDNFPLITCFLTTKKFWNKNVIQLNETFGNSVFEMEETNSNSVSAILHTVDCFPTVTCIDRIRLFYQIR